MSLIYGAMNHINCFFVPFFVEEGGEHNFLWSKEFSDPKEYGRIP